jgi:hypothetical protein
MEFCEDCNCFVPYANWDQHIYGRKHQTNTEFCNTCECAVPYANWDEHIYGRKHQTNTEFCNTCECAVPYVNWDEHVNGRHHQSNIEYFCESNGDGDDSSNDEWDEDGNVEFCDEDGVENCSDGYFVVHVNSIAYKQNTISNTFRDGTTLAQGIANLQSLPEHYKQCDDWDGEDPEYVVNVWSNEDDGYVAVNSRTLHCYTEAGFLYVPVNVVGEFTGRRTFATVRVRVPPPVVESLYMYA